MRRQFALKGLLLCTLFACIGLAILCQYHSTERFVVAKIEALGGRIDRRPKGTFYCEPAAWISSRWPEVFDNIETVYLSDTDFGAEGNCKLSALTGIERLFLSSTKVSDGDLLDICRLGNLKTLCLSDSKITDKGMIYLLDAKHLHQLELDGCAITDSGVKILSRAPNLEILVLDRCRITDEAISSLIVMWKLRLLHLRGTFVTLDGVRRFRNARPQVEIYYKDRKSAGIAKGDGPMQAGRK